MKSLLTKLKKGKKKDKKGLPFHFPTNNELYENPIKEIVIKPTWYDNIEPVCDFIEQLLTGYLWSLDHDQNIIAVHHEKREAERILHTLQSLRHREKTKEQWVPNYDEHIELLLVDFARLVPKMWD